MKKTKQKWCLRILIWLVAVLVLLGVADSCRVQEDPHRTLVQGSLQEMNDSWTLETDQQAVYDIPESMGESLMLSIRSTKQKFSLGLRAADGQQGAGAGHPDEAERLLLQAQPLCTDVLPALRPLRRGAWRSDGDDAQHLHSGGPPSDPGADRADAGRRHLDTDGFRAADTGDGQGESRRVRLAGHLQPHSAFHAGIRPLYHKE